MLGIEKNVRALYGDEVGSQADNPVVQAKETANSARAGLVLSLLAIILALGVYVALDAKLAAVVQASVDLPAKVATLDAKVTAIEGLPAKLRKQLAAERVAAFAASAERLAASLDTDDQKAVLGKISEMAKQLQADVAK